MIEMKGHAVPEHPMVAYMRGHVRKGYAPKNVTKLDGIGTYAAVGSYTFTGDCRSIQDLYIPALPTAIEVIVGDSLSSAAYIAVEASGKLKIQGLGGSILYVPAANIPIAQKFSLQLERLGTVVSAYIDEVLVASIDSPVVVTVWDSFARNKFGNYFAGYALPAQWYDLTLPTADQLVRDYRFDRNDGVVANYAPSGADGVTGWGTIENPAVDTYARYVEDADGNLIGVDNLVSNGRFDTDTGWTKEAGWGITGSAATATAAPNLSTLVQAPALLAGQLYRTSYNVISRESGAFVMLLKGAQGTARNIAGRYEEDIVAGSFVKTGIRSIATTTGVVDNIKMQHLIKASDLHTLRKRIAKLLTYKAGKQRVIPKFDGVGMYGEFPEWTATNYRITVKFRRKTANLTVNERLLAHGSVNDAVYLNTSGSLTLRLTNSTDGSPSYTTVPVDHRGDSLVTSELTKHADTVSFRLNEESIYSAGRPDKDDIRLNRVTNGSYFEGEMLLFSLEDLDSPLTNSRLYLMDDATGILYDALAVPGDTSTQGQIVNPAPDAYPVFTYQGPVSKEWLGVEQGFTPSFMGSSWVDNLDGSYTYVGNQFQSIEDNNSLVIGQDYRLEVLTSGMTTGALLVRTEANNNFAHITENVLSTIDFTADGTTMRFASGYDISRYDGTMAVQSQRQLLKEAN